MKRLLYLTTLSIVAALILTPAALAQINPVVDDGDNIDPGTGQVVGDDTPDCERPEDILESGLCRPTEPAPSGADGTITCADFEDQGQAQEAYNRGVDGDPAYDPDVLDEDGDGIACEGLPTAFDPNGTYTCETFLDQVRAQDYFDRFIRDDPAADPTILDEDGDGIACEELPTETASNEPDAETTTGTETATEETTASGTGGGTTGEETTGREKRERTKGEGTGGGEGETTSPDGTTPGSDGGEDGSGGSADGSGKGDGGYQGGLALAINDGLGNISRGRLPSTGGGWAVLLIAGAVLIGGGWLLVRRFSSR